jgi:uncharacterized protein DUF262
MTFQTGEPVREISMGISGRAWGDLIHQVETGNISYDIPYQRGDVWTSAQRIMLIYSILSGTPVPALILNDRPHSMWFGPDGEQLPIYAVIDGKQRITTVQMFMAGELAVPASWFPAERIIATEDTEDGPYVRYPGLSRVAQRFFENKPVPTAEAHVKTVAEEAAIYLRVNGSGTPQDDADLDRAGRIAGAAS